MKKKLLNICLLIAKNSLPNHPRKDGYKHFSFVIQDNRIIEWGTNMSGLPLYIFGYQSHQMIHSENLAYKRARGLLDKNKLFDIINVRLNNNSEIKISKPCNCCLNYLKDFGCGNIWFSKSNGDFEKIKLKN